MMVYGFIIARKLGPDGNGLYSAAYSIGSLTSIFISAGMDTWMLRKAGQVGNTPSISGLVISNKVIQGTFWLIVLVALAPTLRPDIYSYALLLLCTIDILIDQLFTTATNALNIEKKLRKIGWMTLVSRGGRLASLLLLLALDQTGVLVLIAGRIIAALVGLIWALAALRPTFSFRLPANQLNRWIIWKESFPFAVSEFLNIIYQNADVTMVALMADKISVGLYSPSSGVIHALFIIPFSISSSIIPVLSRLVKTPQPRLFSEFLRSVIGLASIGIVLWASVGIGGKYILPLLLGDLYQISGNLLVILSPILFIKCVEVACSSLLIAGGWQRKRIGPQFLAAALNVLINLWAIPHLGLIGVSWAYLISELILMIGYIYYTIRWLQIQKVSTLGPSQA